jgi:hypothetical protein
LAKWPAGYCGTVNIDLLTIDPHSADWGDQDPARAGGGAAQ